MRRPVVPLLGLVLALLALACNGGGGDGTPTGDASPPPPSPPPLALSPTRADLPLKVAVTVPVFAEFVREIGGDHVEVFSIVPPGANPHTYSPGPEEAGRIAEVDIFFENGMGLDTPPHDAILKYRKDGSKVVPFGPNVASPRAGELGDPSIPAERAGDNPHLWLDPIAARGYADLIADTFIIVDSVNSAFYDANLSAYGDRLFDLYEELNAQLQPIPAEARQLITYHDSFTAFALRYGFETAGFVVEDPGGAAVPAEAGQIEGLIEEAGAPAVFAEVGYDSAALSEAAAGAGVQVCILHTDVQDDSVPTYFDMMRANAAELVRCLGGGEGG